MKKHLRVLSIGCFSLSVFLIISLSFFAYPSLHTSLAQPDYPLYLPVISQSHPTPSWTLLGFNAERVTSLLIAPDWQGHAYASVAMSGLFETQDGGVNWEQLISTRVYDITSHPLTHTTMYIATWSSYGLLWSENAGNTWEPIPGWPSLPPTLHSVKVHPLSSHIILAGSGNWESTGGEIFKSIDGGEQWYSVSTMYTNALTFAFDPIASNLVYAGTKYAGVRKSIDAGNSWFPANEGLPTGTAGAHDISSLVFNPHNPQQIFIATSKGIYLSENGANTWEPLWEGVDANSLVFHPNIATTIYLGTETGLYTSHDNGLTWLSLNPLGMTISINKLEFDPFDQNKLWVATSSGIWLCELNPQRNINNG
jgi:photosystem II stability/assembly factor-like uncharacterized protein